MRVSADQISRRSRLQQPLRQGWVLLQQSWDSVQGLPLRRLKANSGWFLGALTYSAFLAWHGRSTIALTIGLLGAIAVFQIQQGYWRGLSRVLNRQIHWQRWLDGQRHPVSSAILGGAIATLGTFALLSLGEADSTPETLVTLLLITGAASLFTWQLTQATDRSQSTTPLRSAAVEPAPGYGRPASLDFATLTAGLTHPQALQRYQAVRQLLQPEVLDALNQPWSPVAQVSLRSYLLDCLQLLAETESNLRVQAAIADAQQAIQLVQPSHQLQASSAASLDLSARTAPTAAATAPLDPVATPATAQSEPSLNFNPSENASGKSSDRLSRMAAALELPE